MENINILCILSYICLFLFFITFFPGGNNPKFCCWRNILLISNHLLSPILLILLIIIFLFSLLNDSQFLSNNLKPELICENYFAKLYKFFNVKSSFSSVIKLDNILFLSSDK